MNTPQAYDPRAIVTDTAYNFLQSASLQLKQYMADEYGYDTPVEYISEFLHRWLENKIESLAEDAAELIRRDPSSGDQLATLCETHTSSLVLLSGSDELPRLPVVA